MSSVWTNNLKISIFGESHGKAIGAVIDNLPYGEKIDLDDIAFQMERRSPGRNSFSSERREKDQVHVISGTKNGITTGAPLCVLIENKNTDSSSYLNFRDIPRPGTADFSSSIKYKNFNDLSGSGHLSGRLTAALTACGKICQQILKHRDVSIAAHVYSVGEIYDRSFLENGLSTEKTVNELLMQKEIPMIDMSKKGKVKEEILSYKQRGDSIGGCIECAVLGLDAGIGEPIFYGVENVISSLVFAVPGVKGIDFGAGFDVCKMSGSENNDNFIFLQGKIKTETNNHGGVLGGISTSMPIIFKVAMKPTPSIKLPQTTLNVATKETVELKITGRHDPCVVPRAVPVIEAVAAIAILDLLVGRQR